MFISKSMKEKGQGLVEYALILVLVAIVVIAALAILGPVIGNIFSSINSSLASGGGSGGSGAVVVPNPICLAPLDKAVSDAEAVRQVCFSDNDFTIQQCNDQYVNTVDLAVVAYNTCNGN